MIDSLLGVELPLPAKLVVAFLIVLALIALATWVFRRLGGGHVGPTTGRGRQPRLAVIDAASVDGRRRLVLVRRDNVEHLLMIGGPADLVVEQNIVRAVPVSPQGPRPPAEPSVRPVAEPVARPPADAYRERAAPEPAARPRPEAFPTRGARPEPPRLAPVEAPRAQRPAAPRRPEPEKRRPSAEPPAKDGHAPAVDPNLADMAIKLEAALRRPTPQRQEAEAGPVLPGPTPPTVPASEPAGPPRPQPAAASEPSAAAAPASPAREEKAAPRANSDHPPPKSMFDSLEEEMASLLGRPPGKQ